MGDKNYVFKLEALAFGILHADRVYVHLVSEYVTVETVCADLADTYAAEFVPADDKQTETGKGILAHTGFATVV